MRITKPVAPRPAVGRAATVSSQKPHQTNERGFALVVILPEPTNDWFRIIRADVINDKHGWSACRAYVDGIDKAIIRDRVIYGVRCNAGRLTVYLTGASNTISFGEFNERWSRCHPEPHGSPSFVEFADEEVFSDRKLTTVSRNQTGGLSI